MIRQVDVMQLIEMGFEESQAREALTVGGGTVPGAIQYLLAEDPPPPPPPPPPPSYASSASNSAWVNPARSTPRPVASSSSSASRVAILTPHDPLAGSKDVRVLANAGLVQCHLSQYSFDVGRSACTCIALTAATQFLQDPIITPDFLESILTRGITNYTQLQVQSQQRSSGSLEHLSAEEVLLLQSDDTVHSRIFPLQLLPGSGIRQGLLTSDIHHPLGLPALLEQIRLEQPPHQWMAVLMTKTPETVLLCFPPPMMAMPSANNASATTTAATTATTATAFWLIDSHPRPALGIESAYAKLHPSLHALCLSLQTIFPCTELGPDIPEMMAMMYNSFDLYPLLLLQQPQASTSSSSTTRTTTIPLPPSSSSFMPPIHAAAATTRTTIPSSSRLTPLSPPTRTTPLSTTAKPSPSTTAASPRTIPTTTTPPPATPTTIKRPTKRWNRGKKKK